MHFVNEPVTFVLEYYQGHEEVLGQVTEHRFFLKQDVNIETGKRTHSNLEFSFSGKVMDTCINICGSSGSLLHWFFNTEHEDLICIRSATQG